MKGKAEIGMSSFTLNDTIVAIASPLGVGGVGIIRMSGPDALGIAKQCCPSSTQWTPRRAHLKTISHPETGETLDEGCVLYFQGPNSFTGQDVVEFQIHSGTQLLRSVLQACEHAGARLAEKGEFTRRAFMNGKIDLIKAEAVMDLMEATNPMAQKVAISHLEGQLLTHITSIRDQLMTWLEQIEGSIDFPEEVPEIKRESFEEEIDVLEKKVSSILKKQDFGEAVRSGVKVVIVGQPNVGKSSLMNQLLGHERAIVTSIPGTTRDYIEGQFNYGGLTFNLYDTAGLRESTQDVVEQLGIQKIQELIDKAHLIFWVIDGNTDITQEDLKIYERIKEAGQVCCIVNKSDLIQSVMKEQLPEGIPVIYCHTKNEKGLSELREYLDAEVISNLEGIDLEWLCNVRQQSVLKELCVNLEGLQSTLRGGFEDDMLATDLKKAVKACFELTGEEITELVLDGVFSRFCVGK